MSDTATPIDVLPSRLAVIHVVPNTIPGLTLRRPTTLWELYCNVKLGRASRVQDGFDNPHVLGRFDSEKPFKVWFMHDAGVTRSLKPEEVINLPHHACRAVMKEGQLTFVDIAIDDGHIRDLAKMYDWTLWTPDTEE